jgi:hypothetical protein
MFVKLDNNDRANVINALFNWANAITLEQDPKISQVVNLLGQLQGFVFTEPPTWIWNLAEPCNSSVSFQEIVKNKLAVPKKKIEKVIKDAGARKTIPKKTREVVWKNQFGSTLDGQCYCCKEKLSALGKWHAGHIVAQAIGGADTSDNLRAVCSACNQSMGTENMEDFKKRCYP